jgi:hypothetical protein
MNADNSIFASFAFYYLRSSAVENLSNKIRAAARPNVVGVAVISFRRSPTTPANPLHGLEEKR